MNGIDEDDELQVVSQTQQLPNHLNNMSNNNDNDDDNDDEPIINDETSRTSEVNDNSNGDVDPPIQVRYVKFILICFVSFD